jgi:hypothetical protein
MAALLYRCPNTGFQVQGYSPEQTSDDDSAYEAVTCLVCQRIHLVNPATGKVLGEDEQAACAARLVGLASSRIA